MKGTMRRFATWARDDRIYRGGRRRLTADERFVIRVAYGLGCWEWMGSYFGTGYGQFTVRMGRTRKNWIAHRYAWARTFGPIPDGLWVLHRCDNPKCVRPDHLFLGTHADNMADMKAKGRGRGRVAQYIERDA